MSEQKRYNTKRRLDADIKTAVMAAIGERMHDEAHRSRATVYLNTFPRMVEEVIATLRRNWTLSERRRGKSTLRSES